MRDSLARQQAALGRARKAAEAAWSRQATTAESSIQKQMGSVRRQAASSENEAPSPFFTVPWPHWQSISPIDLPTTTVSRVVPPMLTCDPLEAEKLDPLISEQARTNSVSEKLVRAVIDQESARYPCAVSPAGAIGLMQLMPTTAAYFQVNDPFDPEQNVMAGSKYLKMLLDKYGGDLRLALGAYNAGPARVDSIGTVPAIPETQNYVDRILKKLDPQVQ